MSVNPSGRYQPVFSVIDGKVVLCECDPDGGYPWEPDFVSCPVHKDQQAQEAMEQVDIEVNG